MRPLSPISPNRPPSLPPSLTSADLLAAAGILASDADLLVALRARPAYLVETGWRQRGAYRPLNARALARLIGVGFAGILHDPSRIAATAEGVQFANAWALRRATLRAIASRIGHGRRAAAIFARAAP